MRTRPRWRRLGKWGCAAVAIALVVADVTSRIVQPEWWSRGAFGGFLSGGALYAWWGGDRAQGGFQPPAGFRLVHPTGARATEWWFRHEGPLVANWKVEVVPIWPALAASVALSAWLFWTDRARPAHLCPFCAYDRGGLAKDAACPECGARPA